MNGPKLRLAGGAFLAAVLGVWTFNLPTRSAWAQDGGGKNQPPKGDPKGDEKKKQDEALQAAKDKAKDQNKPAPKKEPPPRREWPIHSKQPIPIKGWGPARRDAFNSMEADRAEVDPVVVKIGALYFLSRFTDPAEEKNLDQIHRQLRNFARERKNNFQTAFKEAYINGMKTFLLEEDRKLAQVPVYNILLGLKELNTLTQGQGDGGVDVLIGFLAKHEWWSDGSLAVAMDALASAKKQGFAKPAQEMRGADVILKIADSRESLQPIFHEKICETLGVLAFPFRGAVPERSEVATYLARVAAAKTGKDNKFKFEPRVRFEAAIALGNQDYSSRIRGFDASVQAFVFAQTFQSFLEWVSAEKGKTKPEFDAATFKHLAARFGHSAAVMAAQADQAQPAVAVNKERARSLLKDVIASATLIIDGREPDPDAIAEWIKANPPNNPQWRLNQQAEALQPGAPGNAAANRN